MANNELSSQSARPRSRSLVVLAVVGGLSALWSLFLWRQLIQARSGGTPFCGFGEGADCGSLWDSPFAAAIQRLTGMPIAGWGLVWSLGALVLAVLAYRSLSMGRSATTLVSAVRVVAWGGLGVIAILALVSARAGVFCFGCFVSYLLTAAYALVVMVGWRKIPLRSLGRGLAAAMLATLGFYLLLFYPGTKTPKRSGEAEREVVARALDSGASGDTAGKAAAAGEHDPFADSLISQFIASLNPQMAQVLSDALHAYATAPAVPMPPARLVLGSASAPVRITDFTDAMCPACAELHANLEVFDMSLAPGSFSMEPRHFPLDAACNPLLGGEPREDDTRCLAAKALICLENRPEEAAELSRRVFADQQSLDIEKIYALTESFLDRASLTACVESPETGKKLEADIAYAGAHDIHGTPLVLINGRKADAFGPFLYTIIIAKGDPTYPAFAALPPPRPGGAHRH